MRLTKEEIEAFKQEYLKTLEVEETRRSEERRHAQEDVRRSGQDEELTAREREQALAQLKEELEEQFYKRRGYKRYVNHRGKVLWLTPEEYRFRKDRKKRHRGSGGPKRNRWLETALIFGATVVMAVIAGFFLAGR